MSVSELQRSIQVLEAKVGDSRYLRMLKDQLEQAKRQDQPAQDLYLTGSVAPRKGD